MPERNQGKPRKQVAALPIVRDPQGRLRVLMITSRETRRFIVPKGWPMKGLKDHRAAEIEAREEAGVVGRAHPKPVGSYLSWKRRDDGTFQLVKVKVFLLHVHGHLNDWKERGQRSIAWLTVKDAASLIDEPGLAEIVLNLQGRLPKSWRSWASSEAPPGVPAA
ncbi:NUDIX domain-containing protein [Enterovirga sp.]|uniref:NUDIX hydrolase n=1 Tax=Enterovirga sp. TaxID=2026350 RepID=UPI002C066235|nr:NUDIX domain-containing protein [Enterovirga sp.]HMO28363.1 NUDIX domain-containing protein [Enterovirga sp.]